MYVRYRAVRTTYIQKNIVQTTRYNTAERGVTDRALLSKTRAVSLTRGATSDERGWREGGGAETRVAADWILQEAFGRGHSRLNETLNAPKIFQHSPTMPQISAGG